MSIEGNRPRYQFRELAALRGAIEPAMKSGCSILDVGSGRKPFLSLEERPSGLTYVGLDVSAEELATAPPGSYDEAVVSRVEDFVPEFEGRFDAAVSWQVFEHVDSLEATLENIRRYLKPGGVLCAQFSGRFSYFAIVNQLIPARLGHWVVETLIPHRKKTGGEVFPATYDKCWYGAITPLLAKWSEAEVSPIYRGADYLRGFKPAHAAFLKVEDWIEAGEHRNLAGYYRIVARK